VGRRLVSWRVVVPRTPSILRSLSLFFTHCRGSSSFFTRCCCLCSLSLFSLLAVICFFTRCRSFLRSLSFVFAHCHCLCSLSLSSLAVIVFARCHCLRSLLLSLLAVVVFARCRCLCLLSLSSLAVVLHSLSFILRSMSFASSHNLDWPLLLRSFIILLCSLSMDLQIGALVSIWSLVLCSFSCFFALFGGGLWFFAQWCCSLLKVVGQWTKLNR